MHRIIIIIQPGRDFEVRNKRQVSSTESQEPQNPQELPPHSLEIWNLGSKLEKADQSGMSQSETREVFSYKGDFVANNRDSVNFC